MIPASERGILEASALMAPFERETLELMSETTCVLRPDLSVAYVNPAWLSFGTANGAPPDLTSWGPGASVISTVTPALRSFHRDLFGRARDEARVVEHDYECSSAVARRLFRMRVHPCRSGGFVVIHSPFYAPPREDASCAPLEERYRDARGMVVQCANCRRVRRTTIQSSSGTGWDWVPDFVARIPSRTSHGVCEACADFFYGAV